MPPPINPCSARHTIMLLIEVEVPHRTLASVKPAAEVANRMRVPSARQRRRACDERRPRHSLWINSPPRPPTALFQNVTKKA